MAKKMIICPNCNREVEPGLMECPYCQGSLFLSMNQVKAKEAAKEAANHVMTQEEYIQQQQAQQYYQQLNPSMNQQQAQQMVENPMQPMMPQQPMQQYQQPIIQKPKRSIAGFIMILAVISIVAVGLAYAYINQEKILIKTTKKPVQTTRDCKYDGELDENAKYEDGDFIYSYMSYFDSWGMSGSENQTTNVRTKMCTSINGKPVTVLSHLVAAKVDTIDLASFNTTKIEGFFGTFSNARIDYLNLTSFDTSNAEEYTYMFSHSRIKVLNISNFKFDGVMIDHMFYDAKIDTLMLGDGKLDNTLKDCDHIFSEAEIKTIYATNQTTIETIKDELGDSVEIISN